MPEKIKENGNVEQSNKAVRGLRNNKLNTTICKKWANGENKIFFGEEVVTLKEMRTKDGRTTATSFRVQMDQQIGLAFPEKKIMLVVHIDGTTSLRLDRIRSKANEGEIVRIVKCENEKNIIAQYPQFKDYSFVHTMCVVTPDKLTDMKNEAREIKQNLNAQIELNYGLDGILGSNKVKNGIDCILTISELINALNEAADNPDRFVIDQFLLANIWISDHQEYKYMPYIELTDQNALTCRDRLIEHLQSYSYRYGKSRNEKDEIDSVNKFMDVHKIKYNKSTTFKQKVRDVVAYLSAAYPEQIDKTQTRYYSEDFWED